MRGTKEPEPPCFAQRRHPRRPTRQKLPPTSRRGSQHFILQPAILIRLLTNPRAIEPTNPPPQLLLVSLLSTCHPAKLRIPDPRAIRDTLVRPAGLSRHRYPRLESDPCQRASSPRAAAAVAGRRVSGGFHDTRSTWAIDSKVSSNPEIELRGARRGLGASLRQDSGNRTKSNYPETPGSDVYETFREGWGRERGREVKREREREGTRESEKKREEKSSRTDSCRNYGLCGVSRRSSLPEAREAREKLREETVRRKDEREEMEGCRDPRCRGATRDRIVDETHASLAGDFRNAPRGRGYRHRRESIGTCGETA